jgi:hypothetical protein
MNYEKFVYIIQFWLKSDNTGYLDENLRSFLHESERSSEKKMFRIGRNMKNILFPNTFYPYILWLAWYWNKRDYVLRHQITRKKVDWIW